MPTVTEAVHGDAVPRRATRATATVAAAIGAADGSDLLRKREPETGPLAPGEHPPFDADAT